MSDIDDIVRSLDEQAPLLFYTGASMTYSSVRRMKAEKDLALPLGRRTGRIIAVKSGKRANQLTEDEWEELYLALCGRLKRSWPDLYERLFSEKAES